MAHSSLTPQIGSAGYIAVEVAHHTLMVKMVAKYSPEIDQHTAKALIEKYIKIVEKKYAGGPVRFNKEKLSYDQAVEYLYKKRHAEFAQVAGDIEEAVAAASHTAPPPVDSSLRASRARTGCKRSRSHYASNQVSLQFDTPSSGSLSDFYHARPQDDVAEEPDVDDASEKPAREMRRRSGLLRKRAEEILAACKADTDAAAREFVSAAHVAVASAVASAFSTLARDEEEAAVPEKEEEDEAAAKASKAIVRNAIQSIVAAERDAEYHRMAAQLEQAKQLNDELEAKLAEASWKLAEASTKLAEALNQINELRWGAGIDDITANLNSLNNEPAAETDAGAGAWSGSVPIFQSLDNRPAPLPETDDDPPSGVATTAVYAEPPPAPSSLAGYDSAKDVADLIDYLLDDNDDF